MKIFEIKDLEKYREDLEKLESAEINGVFIKNLRLIPLETLIYLRKELNENYIEIEIKTNEDFFKILENLSGLDKNRIYFITCEDGIRSSTLCDILRDEGFIAYWSLKF